MFAEEIIGIHQILKKFLWKKKFVINELHEQGFPAIGVHHLTSTSSSSSSSSSSITNLGSKATAKPLNSDTITTNSTTFLSFPLVREVYNGLSDVLEVTPFGLGDKTIVDETYRKGKQILPNSLSFFPHDPFVHENQKIIKQLEKGLLLSSDYETSIEFDKLLVYQEGDFFKPHKDTQRSPDHFASIVAFLPSVYEGGDLILSHNGDIRTFNYSLSKPENNVNGMAIPWVAFYTDCNHEILPLKSGYRLTLAYNVFRTPKETGKASKKVKKQKDFKEIEESKEEVEKSKEEMFQTMDVILKEQPFIPCFLDHCYSPATSFVRYLKGSDFWLAQLFQDRYQLEVRKVEYVDGMSEGDEGEWDYIHHGNIDGYKVYPPSLAHYHEQNSMLDEIFSLTEPELGSFVMTGKSFEPGGNSSASAELQYMAAALLIKPKNMMQPISTTGSNTDVTFNFEK